MNSSWNSAKLWDILGYPEREFRITKNNSNDGSVCQGTSGRFFMTGVETGLRGYATVARHHLVNPKTPPERA